MIIDPNLVSAVVTTFVAVFSYLVKSYFKKIHDEIAGLRLCLGRLDGRLDALSSEIRANTVEGAQVRTEIKAVWRFIDGAHKRATDHE
jgi:ABC-type antimicrobial peptide transport system permease subunit